MPQSKTGSKKQKRHFTAVIGTEEQGLYNSYNPSSAARKAVSKLCAEDKKRQVEFYIRETTIDSNKKTYGPYLGFVKKLKEPIQLEGRVIKYAPYAKLSKNTGEEGKLSSKLNGGSKKTSKKASKKTSKKGSKKYSKKTSKKDSKKVSKNSKIIMRGGNENRMKVTFFPNEKSDSIIIDPRFEAVMHWLSPDKTRGLTKHLCSNDIHWSVDLDAGIPNWRVGTARWTNFKRAIKNLQRLMSKWPDIISFTIGDNVRSTKYYELYDIETGYEKYMAEDKDE